MSKSVARSSCFINCNFLWRRHSLHYCSRLLAELPRPEGPPSGAPYSYGKEKETHQWIFSWLSWLAVLLVGAYARWRRRSRARWRPIIQTKAWQRHAALVYCVLLLSWTSMLWSTDTCQNKVSADSYHVTITRAQVYSASRSRVFLSWPLIKFWFLIRSRAHAWFTCWEQGRIVRKAVNANPGLKVTTKLLKLRTEGQTIYRKPGL